MKEALMLYSSMTGRTERMAERMISYMKEASIGVKVKTFVENDIDVQQLLAYDMIFVGVYTWADGELPLEAEDLFDEIHTLDFTGKVCGVFGSADSSYEDYGTAVEIMYEELEDAGATMVPDSIIVDLEPDEAELKQCEKMVATAIDMT